MVQGELRLMTPIPVIVMTSDKYLNAMRPFAYLFNKYWSCRHPVTVVGFAEPDFELPRNFLFVSMGSMADYPVNKWSDALIDFLEDDGCTEHFVLMLEDYWLSRPVNQEAIRMLHDYARQFRNVLKIDLMTDRLYAGGMTDYDNCGYLDLVLSDHKSQYHMSLMTGIWNRDLMLRFLERGETPWQVELEGTPRVAAAGNEVLVLGTRQAPIRHILAHRRGRPEELLLDGLKPVDITEMHDMGILFT